MSASLTVYSFCVAAAYDRREIEDGAVVRERGAIERMAGVVDCRSSLEAGLKSRAAAIAASAVKNPIYQA